LESQELKIPQLQTIYHGPIQGSKITHAAASMLLQKRKLNNRSMVVPSKEEDQSIQKGTLDIIPESLADFMNHTERKVAAGGFRGTL